MKNLNLCWFLEWSGRGGCFHVDEVGHRISENLSNAINKDYWPDYAPIGVFESHEAAADAGRRLRAKYPNKFKRMKVKEAANV